MMAETDTVNNGVHDYTAEEHYVYPDNELVLQSLENFRNHKLGLMMHWAPVSQIGIYESWCMADDSAEWSKSDVDWTDDMEEFREQYKNLATTFNPIRFQPSAWAKVAKECGFKYLVFTTKHHDGFCMWDTATTDYKITNPTTPFSTHQYADICKSLFNAFREQGIAIHTYFSKPDWSSPYYWSPSFSWENGLTDRNVNYDIVDHPEIWEKFVAISHQQIKELLTNYGRIEALWLDGGWVRPDNQSQDIKIPEIVEYIRATSQPHLLAVDRTVGGSYENFITPEQTIPENPILVPWESCVTIGNRFSYSYDDTYKSPRELVHLFIQIIAKGGNLALNIAPQPDGRLPVKAVTVLKQFGAFVNKFSEAIFETRACAPYIQDNVAYTQRDQYIYVFYLYSEDETTPRDQIIIPNFVNVVGSSLVCDDGEVVCEAIDKQYYKLTIVRRTSQHIPYADVIRLTVVTNE